MQIVAQAEPMDNPPIPGTFYLTFQRQLAASDDIAYLANVLAHVHWKYEGWPGEEPRPLGGDLKRIYERAACAAVRLCSEPDVKVASSRAQRWGLNAFDALMENVQTVDSERGEELIRSFIKQCVDVYRFSLVNGVNKLAPQEQVLLAEIEGRDDDCTC